MGLFPAQRWRVLVLVASQRKEEVGTCVSELHALCTTVMTKKSRFKQVFKLIKITKHMLMISYAYLPAVKNIPTSGSGERE